MAVAVEEGAEEPAAAGTIVEAVAEEAEEDVATAEEVEEDVATGEEGEVAVVPGHILPELSPLRSGMRRRRRL